MCEEINETELLNDLCKRFGLKEIKIIPVNKENYNNEISNIFDNNPQRKGCFIPLSIIYKEPIIYVLDDLPDGKFLEILLHEFRHYWQFIVYNDLFMWWSENRDLYENPKIRDKYDILEVDAKNFASMELKKIHIIDKNKSDIIDNSQYSNIEWLNCNKNTLR